ncbi:MAG: methyltransferase domain-containing protein [Enterobacteriaceae bacterium]
MGSLKRFALRALVEQHHVSHLIDTVFGQGTSSLYALSQGFTQVLSCENHLQQFAQVPRHPQLQVMNCDSLAFLDSAEVHHILSTQRSLLLLCAHYPGADAQNSPDGDAQQRADVSLSVLSELNKLQGRADNSLIIIDDARRSLPEQRLPEPFAISHELHFCQQDQGYVVLWPKEWGPCTLTTQIVSGDITTPFTLNLGVPGSTCISINRRLMDARFCTRWLVGNGIDIGGGPDSIGLYRPLFPLMGAVTLYDLAQGDAQYLANVGDNEFDFVYSAHCLEHVYDPGIALSNWLRVVKPGGHLVITVPDEDLYEQGVWPSTYNSDHKHTFTIHKRQSWSPVSINILTLLQSLKGDFSIEKIERLDHSHLDGYGRFDQTRTAFAESAIEMVLQKNG